MCIKDRFTGEETLKAFFYKFVEQNTIAKRAVPDRIEDADAIPKTSVGKIDKKAIRQWYRQ